MNLNYPSNPGNLARPSHQNGSEIKIELANSGFSGSSRAIVKRSNSPRNSKPERSSIVQLSAAPVRFTLSGAPLNVAIKSLKLSLPGLVDLENIVGACGRESQ